MPPKILYHYTSFSSFQSIILHKQLWATNVKYLNDAIELTHALSIAKDYANSLFTRRGTEKSVRSIVERWLGIDALERMSITACVVSFSEKPDSLSQWRAYSHGGTGICFGLDYDLLERLVHRHGESGEQLVRCIYNAEEKLEFIEKLIREPLEKLCEYKKMPNPEDTFSDQLAEVFVELATKGPTLKHQAFEDEHEWRYVRHGHERERPNLPASSWNFRSTATGLVPYLLLDLADGESGPLSLPEVVIGPNPHPETAKKSVEMFLQRSGVQVDKIRSSDAPFRNW